VASGATQIGRRRFSSSVLKSGRRAHASWKSSAKRILTPATQAETLNHLDSLLARDARSAEGGVLRAGAYPRTEAAFDFTDGSELGVTIAGQVFLHLLVRVRAHVLGLDVGPPGVPRDIRSDGRRDPGSLVGLCGDPLVLRSTNLSAATQQLKLTGGRSLTRRYQALLDHYDMTSTRIDLWVESHENGAVEQRHYRTKRAIPKCLTRKFLSRCKAPPRCSAVGQLIGVELPTHVGTAGRPADGLSSPVTRRGTSCHHTAP
jgi:hypothetical protein